MTFYEEMRDIATDVLKEFSQSTDGQPIKFIKVTPGNGPPDNPGPSVPTPYDVIGATVNGVSAYYVSTGLAVKSDLQMIMAVDPRYQPAMTDKVAIGAQQYKITRITPKPAAGTPAVYELIIGKL